MLPIIILAVGEMGYTEQYKLVEGDGITAVIISEGKILLVKRINIPFISNPGIWTFVMGSKKKGEEHLSTAYREIDEEVSIGREHLEPIFEKKNALMFDAVKKKHMWKNTFFIFHTKNPSVRINYESQSYRWADFDELLVEKEYTNIFIDKEEMLDHIQRALHGKEHDKK